MANLQQTEHSAGDGDGNFKLWSSCRRKIIDAIRCSGGMSRRRKSIKSPECRSDSIRNNGRCKQSGKVEMKMTESSSEEEKSVVLKEVVKRLQGGGDGGDVLRGAKEVRELAKGDAEARTNFGLIGAIPPLVAMLDSDDICSQIAALYALLNLGIGNDLNKSAIVEAGAIHKMLDLTKSPMGDSPNADLTAAVVANLLGLSALDSNKPVIGSSGAISFLIKTLRTSIKVDNTDDTDDTNSQVIEDCLRAIYNLSILPSNVLIMVEIDGFVPFLLTAIGGNGETSDRILSILANIVSTSEGRHAVSSTRDSFTVLVDVLKWMDSPSCQEKAAYILMVMAYKSNVDQRVMIETGIMSSLLELTLLGSTLAQKRASRILEILRNSKGKQSSKNIGGVAGATMSAPLCGSDDNDESSESSSGFSGTNAVKQLVEQSLQSNMRRIVKRANLQHDFVSLERLKSSVASYSSSKSLPF